MTLFYAVWGAGATAERGGGEILLFDLDCLEGYLEGFAEECVVEIVFLSLGDPKVLFQFADAFLQVVVIDCVAISILKSLFTGFK